MRKRLAAIILSGTCLAACNGATSGSHPGLVELRYASEPLLAIGKVDGSAHDLLAGVTGAVRLSDGRIVVADCGSSELRYFDNDGSFIRSVGRSGSGPGEFRRLVRIFRLGGDTVAAFDLFNARVSVFTPDGDLFNTLSFGALTPSLLHVVGRFADGAYLGRRANVQTMLPEGTRYRTGAVIYRLDPESGQAEDSLHVESGDAIAPPHARAPAAALRLGRTAILALSANGTLYYGAQDDRGLLMLDSRLEITGSIPTITRSEVLTSSGIDLYEEMVARGDHIPEGGMEGVMAAAYVDSLPAYGDVVAGEGDQVWVQDPVRPGVYPLVWTMYDRGRAVSRSELPRRFFPFQFGRDWVLGVAYDSLNVERVQLLQLSEGTISSASLPPRHAGPPVTPGCSSRFAR